MKEEDAEIMPLEEEEIEAEEAVATILNEEEEEAEVNTDLTEVVEAPIPIEPSMAVPTRKMLLFLATNAGLKIPPLLYTTKTSPCLEPLVVVYIAKISSLLNLHRVAQFLPNLLKKMV